MPGNAFLRASNGNIYEMRTAKLITGRRRQRKQPSWLGRSHLKKKRKNNHFFAQIILSFFNCSKFRLTTALVRVRQLLLTDGKVTLALGKILRLDCECFFHGSYYYIFNWGPRMLRGNVKIEIKIGDLDETNCFSFLLNGCKMLIGVHVSKKTKGKRRRRGQARACQQGWYLET